MSDLKQYGSFFQFDDILTTDYYVWISGTGTYDSTARELERYQVPGRSGDLILDGGRYSNLDLTYPAFISRGFPDRFDAFRAAMLSKNGYFRLTDSYHPAEFRMAAFIGELEPETGAANKSGSFEITFNCKPQRWLLSGETVTTLTASGSIRNPTRFAARPLIRIYGTGTVGIGDNAVTITAADGYTDLDCEIMEAYKGTTSCNSLVRIQGNDYPALEPGSNGITLGSGISKVQITPRWWTL